MILQTLIKKQVVFFHVGNINAHFVPADKEYAHQMVRTDHKEIKLDAFLVPCTVQPVEGDSSSTASVEVDSVEVGVTRKRKLPHTPNLSPAASQCMKKRQHRPVHLTSVKNLISSFNEKQHKGMLIAIARQGVVLC